MVSPSLLSFPGQQLQQPLHRQATMGTVVRTPSPELLYAIRVIIEFSILTFLSPQANWFSGRIASAFNQFCAIRVGPGAVWQWCRRPFYLQLIVLRDSLQQEHMSINSSISCCSTFRYMLLKKGHKVYIGSSDSGSRLPFHLMFLSSFFLPFVIRYRRFGSQRRKVIY